jgi:ABC-type proline/glycine betaine transport system ATPase subunit
MIVTHDMREAFALANRIGVLDAGRLIAYDTPQALSGSTDAHVRELLAGASLLANAGGASHPVSAS